MSQFYDQASLVTIPSGYKNGKVYSQKPLSTSGELTFTRNSNATRVDADGLVEKVRTNILLQSQTLDSASWSVSNATKTANTAVAPDGTTTADTFAVTANFGIVYQAPSISSGIVCTYSVYVKNIDAAVFTLQVRTTLTAGLASFNFSGATLTSSSLISGIAQGYTDVGNGWYRVFVTFITSEANQLCRFQIQDSGDSVYLWGAQLEQGLVATSYIETTTTAMSEFAGVTASSVADVPRLDYSGGASCPSLLLESQRTNIATYSEQFDNAAWIKSGNGVGVTPVVTANNGISPDGYQNADKIDLSLGGGTSSSDWSWVYQTFSVTANQPQAVSIYLKAATAGDVGKKIRVGLISYVEHTLTADWTRVELNQTIGSTASYSIGFRLRGSEGTASTASLYAWGAQLEQNAAYATSYIPTLSSAVTRLADACSKTGISSLIGSDAGTIYLEAAALANDLSERRFALSDGTTSNVARVGFTNVSNRILAVLYNGSNQCVLTYNGGDITAMNKIAFTWATNDFALFVNGVKRASDVSGSTFAPNTLNALHFNEGDGSGNEIEGKFDQVILFTSRLSDTELENLTAL